MMQPLTFWYEFASTYSYLSAMRIDTLARTEGVEVVWKPFLLGPIFRAQGWDNSPFNIYPAKGRYMWRDMERKCAAYGLPFQRPDQQNGGTWPRASIKAARLAIAALDLDWGQEFTRLVYTGEFSKDADITDDRQLADWVEAAGGNPDTAFQLAQSETVKNRLRQNTEDAMALGLFGAPSFTIGDELFWGDDRLEEAINRAITPG